MSSEQILSEYNINQWVSVFKSWPVHIQNQALKQLDLGSFSGRVFKTKEQVSVPMPTAETQRKFGFQLIGKAFSTVEFIVDDFYATRMSLNQDRWTTPIIREDRFEGTILECFDERLCLECTYNGNVRTGPIVGRVTFNISQRPKESGEESLRILYLNMKETDIFNKIPKFKPYIEEWKEVFEGIAIEEIKLDTIVAGTNSVKKAGHTHDHDSSCCQ